MSINDRILKSHQRSTQLLASLSSTYVDPSARPLNLKRIKAINDNLVHLQRPLKLAEAATLKEHHEFQSLDKSRVRKSFANFTGRTEKFDANKSKEEQEWHEAQQKEDELKAKQLQLQEDLRRAEAERGRLADLQSKHNAYQAELDELYSNVFAGPTLEYPEHQHARYEYEVGTNGFNEAQKRCDAANRVIKCLTDAHNYLTQANYAIADAKDMSSMDMIGGGAMISAKKREDMNRAQQALMMADRSIFEAHTLDQEVPLVNQSNVGAQGSGLTEIFFDNIFTDIRVNDEIKASMIALKGRQDDNHVQLNQARQRLEARQAELMVATQKRDDARWELQKVRTEICDRVANGGGSNYAPGADPGQFAEDGSSNNYRQSPPAYFGVA